MPQMQKTRTAIAQPVLWTFVFLLAANAFAVAQEIPVPTPRPPYDAPASTPAEPSPTSSQTPEDRTSPASARPAPASDGGGEARSAVPPVVHQIACPALRAGRVNGKIVPAVRQGDCGADSPLQLKSVADVMLSGEPLSTCAMAEGLANVGEAAKVAARDILGTELTAIVTGPGYECRRRNRAATGKLSEHAFANALDIAGFSFADGRRVTVEADWPHLPASDTQDDTPADEAGQENAPAGAAPLSAGERASTPEAKFLLAVRDAACGIFTTVLSPDSNSAHHSHLHFDLGCHGKTCTYLICE